MRTFHWFGKCSPDGRLRYLTFLGQSGVKTEENNKENTITILQRFDVKERKKERKKPFSAAGFRWNGMPDLARTLFMLIQNTEHWRCQMASAAATTQSENAFSPALSVTDCARTGHQLSQQSPATTKAVAAVRNTRQSPRKRSGFVKHGQLM